MSEQKPPSPSPQFIRSTQAAVAYWHKRTQKTDDDTIRQLDSERQNLFQVVQFGLALRQTQHDTAIIALQTFDLVERQGYWQEWIPVLKQATASCIDKQLPLKLKLLSKLGQLQRFTQQLAAAIRTHHEAEGLAQQAGDRQNTIIAYHDLSEDYLHHHNYISAEEYGHAALIELSNLEGMEHWKSLILNTLGKLARFRGDYITSEKMLLQAVAIRRTLKHPIPLLRTLNNLAITLQTTDNLNAALSYYEEASALLTATPYKMDKIMIQINLGALYSSCEQWSNAEATLRLIDFTYLNQSNKTHYEAAALQGGRTPVFTLSLQPQRGMKKPSF